MTISYHYANINSFTLDVHRLILLDVGVTLAGRDDSEEWVFVN